MVDCVSQDVKQGIGELFKNTAVEFYFLARDAEYDLLAAFFRKVANSPRQPVPNGGKGHQSNLQHLVVESPKESGKFGNRRVEKGGTEFAGDVRHSVLVGYQLSGKIDQVVEHTGPDPDGLLGFRLFPENGATGVIPSCFFAVFPPPGISGRHFFLRWFPGKGIDLRFGRIRCKPPFQVGDIPGSRAAGFHVPHQRNQEIRPFQEQISGAGVEDPHAVTDLVHEVFHGMGEVRDVMVFHGSAHSFEGMGHPEQRVDSFSIARVFLQCHDGFTHAVQVFLGFGDKQILILGHVHHGSSCV